MTRLHMDEDGVVELLNGEARQIDAVVAPMVPDIRGPIRRWLFGSPSVRELELAEKVRELTLTLEATEDQLTLRQLELEAMALMHERLVKLLQANQLVAAGLVDELTGGGKPKEEQRR